MCTHLQFTNSYIQKKTPLTPVIWKFFMILFAWYSSWLYFHAHPAPPTPTTHSTKSSFNFFLMSFPSIIVIVIVVVVVGLFIYNIVVGPESSGLIGLSVAWIVYCRKFPLKTLFKFVSLSLSPFLNLPLFFFFFKCHCYRECMCMSILYTLWVIVCQWNCQFAVSHFITQTDCLTVLYPA